MTTVFYRDKSTPLPEENSTVAHYTITSFIDETRSSILFLGFDQTINQKVSQSIDHIKYQDEVSIDYHNEYHNIPVLSNQVVLKFIKVTELSEKATESEINISRFLSSFHHPHIINIFEDFSYQPYRVLSMEFAPFGSLKDLYDPTRTFGLNEDTVLTITFQILEALEFMHRNNIWHRDIKLENILVFDNNAKFPYVKISDFGLAVNVQNNHPNDRVGSLGYVAPEVVKGNQYDEKIDLWALGVIVYYLLSGDFPFPMDLSFESRRKLLMGKYSFLSDKWSTRSREVINFIENLLVVDPSKRMSASEALCHPWISSFRNHVEEISYDDPFIDTLHLTDVFVPSIST